MGEKKTKQKTSSWQKYCSSIQINKNYTHFLLEPAHGLLFADTVPETDAASFPLLVSDAESGSAQNLNTGQTGSKEMQSLIHITLPMWHLKSFVLKLSSLHIVLCVHVQVGTKLK